MIITIGRQYGSGGSEIAKKLAEKLQLPYYDKNIIEHVADKLGFSSKYVEKVEEKPTGSFLFSMATYSYSGANVIDGMLPAEMKVSTAQTQFILEKAEEGKGVFVGRCADYILKDHPKVTRVFLYADMETRVKNVMEQYKLGEREAVRGIQQADKQRSMYYNTNTQARWGARESYDLLIDTGKLGEDGCVELLEKYCLLRK